MSKKIFINLPISDLPKAMAFYEAIGFTNNPQFSDETGACMVFSDEIYVMILTHEKFKSFITKEIADTHKTIAVINSIGVDSMDEVNVMTDAALKMGGHEPNEPRDYGFMYQRSFEDLDGHLWEVFFMDMSKFPQA